jgi:hypothetical protein
MLDGAAVIASATGNASVAATAADVALAAVAALSDGAGVFTEPCGGSCGSNHDSWLFKGIFVRHVGYLLNSSGALSPPQAARLARFLTTNVEALLANGSCVGVPGYTPYGLRWDGPCDQHGTATVSAALDLLTAALSAALTGVGGGGARSFDAVWPALATGACVDAAGRGMPACVATGVAEAACAAAAAADGAAAAYDFTTDCLGVSECRVRTLGGAGACAPGWAFAAGAATAVTGGDGAALSLCAVRPPPA